MTRAVDIRARARARLHAFAAEDGAVLVELAVVLPLFLLLLFGLIDFGRLGYEYVMATKATDLATRIAVARPPACNNVPETNDRGAVVVGVVPPRFGTACGSGTTVCYAAPTVTCTGAMTNATVAEIWGKIGALMPPGATAANLRFSYAYDKNLGFLGGPYVPVVTVELTGLTFKFASPLGAMAAFAGGKWAGFASSVPFPAMGASLPGEDLALGEAG